MATNYKQIIAIQQANEKRIKEICPDIDKKSGIYIFYRVDENGIKHAYVGQAKKLLTRCGQHLSGYQYIDLSIKKHSLYSKDNKYGYQLAFFHCEEEQLDENEQLMIRRYAQAGFQLKNKTLGGQGKGKEQFVEYKPTKTYRDGIKQGEKNAQKFVAQLFSKNLTYSINGNETANKQKAYDKFTNFIKGVDDEQE